MGMVSSLRKAKRLGITRDEAEAIARKSVKEAAEKDKWLPIEAAMTLAAHMRDIDTVYGKPK